MKQQLRSVAAIGCSAVALAFFGGMSTNAQAAFMAYICGDVACATPLTTHIVTDNMAGDGSLTTGLIISTFSFGGLTVIVNTTESKPIIGSAIRPQLDITFTVTGVGSAWLYAADTDFTGKVGISGGVDGNTSAGASEQIGIFGANSNTDPVAGSLPGTILATSPLITGTPFHGVTPTVNVGTTTNPYELTIGLAVTNTVPGTTTGDFNTHTTIPEPATLALLGLGLAGLGFARRRRA